VPRPRDCARCGVKPVAHAAVKFCYDCRPTFRTRKAPPCKRCGSLDYYSAGLCQRCHKYAPPLPSSCLYCQAWGLFKTTSGVCPACLDWRRRHPGDAECRSCSVVGSLHPDGVCRLCWRRARVLARDVDDPRCRAEAVTGGHQLFLSGMEHALALATPKHRRPPPRRDYRPRRTRSRKRPVPLPVRPVIYRQLLLFDTPRVLSAVAWQDVGEPPNSELREALDAVALDHGERHGWTIDSISEVRRALRVLLHTQDTPGAPIKAGHVAMLSTIGLRVAPTIEVLTTAGMLDDDRTPAIVAWFEERIAGLPAEMVDDLRVWFDIRRAGSTRTPRLLPRTDRTTRNNLTAALPALRAWANDHTSLREITRDDVLAVLPASGTPRVETLQGLRTIFQVLKARRLVFTNPTARIFSGMPQTRTPVPLNVEDLRQALHSTDPTRAALAALLIFHGLRPRQLRALQLTDVRDGRLHVDGHAILLAPEARIRLASYLQHRAGHWPNTANSHVFIHSGIAGRTTQTTYKWINTVLGLHAQAVREDRILDEVQATGGDVRRICDLFGITVGAALRYAATADPPSLAEYQRRTTQHN
jgi:hypothetical protein